MRGTTFCTVPVLHPSSPDGVTDETRSECGRLLRQTRRREMPSAQLALEVDREEANPRWPASKFADVARSVSAELGSAWL
jgi:hypothetical protein